MSEARDFAMLHRLPPAGAVAYLQGRGDLTVTHSWQDLWHEEHARQFTISRLTRLDLLGAIRQSLEKSVNGELTRRDWTRDTEKLLKDAGWWGAKEVVDPATGETVTTTFDAARLKLIFDTNTRQAAAAGQWERVQATKKTHPWLRYITKDDDRVRPAHRAWHNLVLPVDDAFWRTHWPPNGWRCRCRVVALSQREYDRGHAPGGAPFNTQPPSGKTLEHVNRRTGEVTRVPAGVDPGFGYNAGQARREALKAIEQAKLKTVAPDLAAAAERAGLKATLIEQRTSLWHEMVDQVNGTMRASGDALQVHTIGQATISALRREGVELQDTAVWVRDQELLHAIRDSKANRKATLPLEVWLDLPRLLQQAAPYLDLRDQALVYVIDLGQRWGKVVVRVNYNEKGRFDGARARIVSNFVQTGGLVRPEDVDAGRYRPLAVKK